MSFSGRRPTGRASRIGKGILAGLDALGTAMADGPKRTRIAEIDKQVKDLLQERDHLVVSLIERGDYEVSDNYDPYWRKPETDADEKETVSYTSDAGRLTQCKGRTTSSRYHDAHPGCPYVEQIHNAHEFTLRD